ncbi:TagK domain-containing protein [Trinickia mobilis]|uniref:TagK domain-containing protein n=1 Tax=Trinickia mobilis TaxID=2816356 RepID=UPI001A8FE12E|nr:TagK domain-containing protein [Trinickia mobilis]
MRRKEPVMSGSAAPTLNGRNEPKEPWETHASLDEQHHARRTIEELLGTAGDCPREDSRGSEAILASISSPPVAGSGKPATRPSGIDADDLIDTLHDQYLRALDDPHASFAEDPTARVPSVDEPSLSSAVALADSASRVQSIEALLSRALVMEDAFGPLGDDGAPDPAAAEPIPEILRLFAPAKYQSAASRRPAASLPALTRREHHSVDIDSPLSAPDSMGSTST